MAEQARKNVKPFGFADKVGYFFGDFGNDFTFSLTSRRESVLRLPMRE